MLHGRSSPPPTQARVPLKPSPPQGRRWCCCRPQPLLHKVVRLAAPQVRGGAPSSRSCLHLVQIQGRQAGSPSGPWRSSLKQVMSGSRADLARAGPAVPLLRSSHRVSFHWSQCSEP